MKIVWVDLPTVLSDDSSEVTGHWNDVTSFTGESAKEEAIEWLRELFGAEAIDDEGRVRLLTVGEYMAQETDERFDGLGDKARKSETI